MAEQAQTQEQIPRTVILDEVGNYKDNRSGYIRSPSGQYLGLELVHKKPTFTMEDVEQVYYGKEGCACGCNGNYYTTNWYKTKEDCEGKTYHDANESMVKRAMNYMAKHEAEGVGIQDGYILTIATSPARHISIYLREDRFKKESPKVGKEGV